MGGGTGGELLKVEGSDHRWEGVIIDEGEQSEVKASHQRRRGSIRGGGERSEVEGSYQRRRGAIRARAILADSANDPRQARGPGPRH